MQVMKYLRYRGDGSVNHWNPVLAERGDMDEVVSVDRPPEYIEDLASYQAEQNKKMKADAKPAVVEQGPEVPKVADQVAPGRRTPRTRVIIDDKLVGSDEFVAAGNAEG